MTKRIMAVAFTCLVFLSIYLLYSSDTNATVISDSSENKKGGANNSKVKEKKGSEIEAMRNEFVSRMIAIQEEKERQIEEDDVVSKEEARDLYGFEPPENFDKQKELGRLTNPYYWKMGPEIIERMWKTSKKDTDWNLMVEKEAAQIVPNGKYKGTKLTYVDCRTDLCKIGFFHKDAQSFSAFYNSDMQRGPWIEGAGHALRGYEETDDGKLLSFIYFTKKDNVEPFFELRRNIARRLGIDISHLEY